MFTAKSIRVAALAGVAILGGIAFSASESRATEGLYCAQDGGRNSYTNCGYYTFQQCIAAISGVGGYCMRNPAVQAYSIEERYVAPRRVIVYR